ncbi:MAG: adenylate/guanylate cyclase domain-containing protein [Myxococcaceae bacterium]
MSSRILTAQARPRPRLPRWVVVALVLFTLSRPLARLNAPAAELAQGVLFAIGLVAGIAGAIWLEERVFSWFVGRWRVLRLLASWLVLPIALLATAVLIHVFSSLEDVWSGFEDFVALAVVSGLWFLLASFGSALVSTIDVLVSTVVQSFRARLALAVFSLLAVVLGGSALLAGGTVWLVDALRSGTAVKLLNLDAPPEHVEELRTRLEAVITYLGENPEFVTAAVFLVVLLLCTPTVVSACIKLAETAMERLHPLSMAMDAVAQGERDLRVEEGGSTDFVVLAQRFNRMIDSLALAERMERAFGMYVSGHVMDRIRAQHGEALLPASLRAATVFFADIRGFTQISERLAPEVLVALLNRYFERVVSVIAAHDGYLNKFIGDAVVVVFNGPIDQPDHAQRAVTCARALQKEVAEMNARGEFPELPEGLHIGVGVASGPMVCGNVGGARQVEYTVIGDTVNLAARLTSSAKGGEILINGAAARALSPEIQVTALEPIKVKGKAEPVAPWRVAA